MLTRKILLADDDEDDRELFEYALVKDCEFVLQASMQNGKEALNFLNSIEDSDLPDIIVLDQNMPKLNGLETLDALRANERFAQITVVIYSTYTDSKLTAHYKTRGAAALLTKPSKMEEYYSMLEQIGDLVKQTIP